MAEEEGELVLSAEDTQMVTGFIITTPHFCHEPTSEARVNFFWPVQIFTDLTKKLAFSTDFTRKSGVFLQI